MKGKQKTFFCRFLFFGGALIADSLEVVEWCRQSNIVSDETTSFFPIGNFEAISEAIMTLSGMLYRLDFSTFYFHKPLMFQIFPPWKFTKT